MTISVWKCERCITEGYSRSAAGVGSPIGLRAIGWHVAPKNEHGEVEILCPSCHPKGMAGAIEQATLIQNTAILGGVNWEHPLERFAQDNASLDALEKRIAIPTPKQARKGSSNGRDTHQGKARRNHRPRKPK